MRYALLCLYVLSLCFGQASEPLDVAILNGRVMDPESGTDRTLNVGIRADKIVSVTHEAVQAKRVIDARGLVVAPGFVDILARLLPQEENQLYKLMDGCTTVVSMHGGPVDLSRYFHTFEQAGSYVNYGSATGYGELRRHLGLTDPYKAASAEQIRQMQELARRAIDDGAVGIGFGINYVPGASYEEVLSLFEVCAEKGVPGHVHSRYKGSVFPETFVASMQELISAAAVTGAQVQMVHIASSAVGSMKTALQMAQGARKHGIDLMMDVHPYLANNTELSSALYDPGWEERFGGITYKDIQVVETGERLTKETFEYYRKKGASVITYFIAEEELLEALRHPLVMVASDGVIENGKGHPRGAGTFARVLGYFVRERKVLSLMEALRKITLMPAQRLTSTNAMRNKGRLQVGADADVVIFDPQTIIDRATYLEPAQYSTGIRYVLVNGKVAVDDGKIVAGTKAGRAIRH